MNNKLCVLRVLSKFHMQCLGFSKLPPNMIVPTGKDTIVCWHPEQEFPYEHTLPLPEEKVLSNSVLRIGEKEIAAMFKRKTQNAMVEELSKITYTTKHRWYPRSRDKRAKHTTPDRPYL